MAHSYSKVSCLNSASAATMKLFLILCSCGIFVGADKLDRTYLPPPGAKFSGGNHDSILAPIELPKEPYFSATTLRPQTPGTLTSNPPGFFETRRPGFNAITPKISQYPSKVPFGQKIGFENEGQFNASVTPESINQLDGTKRTGFISTHSAGTSIQPSQYHNGFTVPTTTTTSYAFTQTTTFEPISEEECFGTTCAYQDGFVDTGVEPDISISHQSPEQFTNIPKSDTRGNKVLLRPQQLTTSTSSPTRFPIKSSDNILLRGDPVNGKPTLTSSELTKEGTLHTFDQSGRPIYNFPGQTIITDTSNIGPVQKSDFQGRPIKSGADFSIPDTKNLGLGREYQVQGFDQQSQPIDIGFNSNLLNPQNNIRPPIQNFNQQGSPINDQNQITQGANIHNIYSSTATPLQQEDPSGRPITAGTIFSDTNTQNYGIISQNHGQFDQQPKQPITTEFRQSLEQENFNQSPIPKVDHQANHVLSGIRQDISNILPETIVQRIPQNRPQFDYDVKRQQTPSISEEPFQQIYNHGKPIVPNNGNFNQQILPIATFNQAEKQYNPITKPGQYSGVYQSEEDFNRNNIPFIHSTSLPQSIATTQVTRYPVNQHGSSILSNIPQVLDDSSINEFQNSLLENIPQSSIVSASTPYPITSLSPSDSKVFDHESVLPTYRNDFQNNRQPSLRPQDSFDQNAVILNYKNIITPNGEFEYSYDTSNGIHADENGTAIDGVKAQGAYSYIGDDGKNYSIVYTADENGFLPKGDHLPTPPPIPEAILRLLEKLNKEEAAGIVDDGLYNEEKYGYKNYQNMMDYKPHGLYTFNKETKTNDIDPEYKKEDENENNYTDNLQRPLSNERRRPSKDQHVENKQTLNYNKQGQNKEGLGKISSLDDIGTDKKEQNYSIKSNDESRKIELKERPTISSSKKQQNNLFAQKNQNIPTRRPGETIINNNRKQPITDYGLVGSEISNENLISQKNKLPFNSQRVVSNDASNEELFKSENEDKNGKRNKNLENDNSEKNKISQNKERLPSIKTAGLSPNINIGFQSSQTELQPTTTTSSNYPIYGIIKPAKGPQYLPSKNQVDVNNNPQNQVIPDLEKSLEEDEIQLQQNKDVVLGSQTRRPTVYKNIVTKTNNEENIEYDNNNYIDPTINIEENTFNSRNQQPYRSSTRKPSVSVRPTSSIIRPGYDNSVQASTRKPSLIIQTNDGKSDGYQYTPPREQFGENIKYLPAHSVFKNKQTTLSPFNTSGSAIENNEQNSHSLRPEISRSSIYKPDSIAISNNDDENLRSGGVNYPPTTRRPIYDQSREINQQITESIQKPHSGYDALSKTSLNYPTSSTPVIGNNPRSQFDYNDNQGYAQTETGNLVTETELPSTFSPDRSLNNIGITRLPYRPGQTNIFSSSTSRPYYPNTSVTENSNSLTTSPEERLPSEKSYLNVPSVVSSSYPSQTSDSINIQEYSSTPQYNQQRELNVRPFAPQIPERQSNTGAYSNTASTYPSQSLGSINKQQGTSASRNYSLIGSPTSSPAYSGRRPTPSYPNTSNVSSNTYSTQTSRPSNNQYGTNFGPDFTQALSSKRPFVQKSSVNKSYIPSSIPSTSGPGFGRIGQNGRTVTDAYGRPISSQDRIKGEDFSGPKQQPRFDPETGYHY